MWFPVEKWLSSQTNKEKLFTTSSKQDEMFCSHTITAIFIPHYHPVLNSCHYLRLLSLCGTTMPPTGASSYNETPHTGHSPARCLLPPCPGHKHRCKSAAVTALPSALLLTLAAEFQTAEHPQCCLVLNHTHSASHTQARDSQGLLRKQL